MRTAELHWSQIRASLFIAIAAIVLFAAVFFFGIKGSPLSRDSTIYGLFDDVSGLSLGATVELGGVVVGQIVSVGLPNLQDGRVPVSMSIERRALSRLGASSVAFTSSHAIVGQRFIGITVRHPNEPPLNDGDSVQTRAGPGLESLTRDASTALVQLAGVLTETRKITTEVANAAEALGRGEGSLGKILHDDGLYNHLDETAANAMEATSRLARGRGPLGALIGDRKMAAELRSSVETLAVTSRHVREGKGILGTLSNDEEAAGHLRQALTNVDAVASRLAEAQGTLGALISDPALLARMNTLVSQLDSLVADVHRNPQRYLKLQAF